MHRVRQVSHRRAVRLVAYLVSQVAVAHRAVHRHRSAVIRVAAVLVVVSPVVRRVNRAAVVVRLVVSQVVHHRLVVSQVVVARSRRRVVHLRLLAVSQVRRFLAVRHNRRLVVPQVTVLQAKARSVLDQVHQVLLV